MKICPACRKRYTDDGLNFCLDDGSVLAPAGPDPAETVRMNRAAFTNPAVEGRPVVPPIGHSTQPRKSSKAWVWIVGIFAFMTLLCGGGFAGFLVYVASLDNDGNVNGTNADRGSAARTPTPTPTRPERADIQKIDLSDWAREAAIYGTTQFADGEFMMSSKQKGYYYVLAAPAGYQTEEAVTSVTVRNVNDAESSLGYGLIFHSNPQPLQKDYALLIDSKKGRYRVVRHEPGKEIDVVAWTDSNAIREGTQENILEARDKSGKVDLFINGRMVSSIQNTHGFKGGVPGLYSGDAVKIGFKNLEIAK